MANKDKILKEILENYPSLVSKKEQLINLIDLLLKNNPNIKIDKEFKENLRSKIEVIIEKEDEDKAVRKLSIFTWIINAISIAFIFWWFYYFFSSIYFFNSDNDINVIYEDIWWEQDLNEEEDNTYKIEDNQIINILWDWLKENVEINYDNGIMESEEANWLRKWIRVMEADISVENFWLEDEEIVNNIIDEKELDFNTFCINNNWDLLNIDWINMCIVDNKICKEEDFIVERCDFVELK